MTDLTEEERAAKATVRAIRRITASKKVEGVWCPQCGEFHDGPALLGFVGPRDLMDIHEDREDIFFDLDSEGWRRHRMVSK